MGRICVELSDELEKQLRFRTVEKFGGKKGDLTRAVEEAVKKWIVKEE
jgi:Ribbon-helix-helix domain